jgi:hypothetical protein
LFGAMSSQQRSQTFEEMMRHIAFQMGEMGRRLSGLVGPVIRFLSDDQLERVLQPFDVGA